MFFWKRPKSEFNTIELRTMADAVRALSLDQIQTAQSGHPGAALGMADVITTLFANHLRFNPNVPNWPGRDRFVLSMGHASAMLYATLHLAGYDVSTDDLRAFRQLGAKTQGHPEYGMLPGIECSTGPLGQGIAMAVGMALAQKIQNTKREIQDAGRIYCMCSDGDLMEGISQEAISFAGYYKLNNLVAIWDNNGISIDGPVATSEDIPGRFLAAGWATIEINGLDPFEINRALYIAKRMKKPTLIACRTQIGYMSVLSGTADVHGNPLSADDASAIYKRLGRDGETFSIQPAADALWARLRNIKIATPTISESKGEVVLDAPIPDISANLTAATKPESTRKIFGRAIKTAMESVPGLIGGSADLTPSNNTRPDIAVDITPDDARGNYVHYGVREHAMAAIMNGLALSGFRPYGGTFLIFSDYMRPGIRLSALMGLPVIYVLTHDSIALGEDGATHQPIEQLASLRLIPNLHVMRPCNAQEVAVCLEMALRRTNGPTALVLSRQNIPVVPGTTAPDDIEKGAYVIYKSPLATHHSPFTIIATGSEVPLAIKAAKILGARGIAASVASMPCAENFRLQSDKFKRTILAGQTVALEAGATAAWREFADFVIGIDTFGAGGPGDQVYAHFGFDADAVAEKILENRKP
ncbi:MAG: transketolase family protein [Rickettsiales bacterium]|jgi:transketolase|nr:transketolase family protein [Rickettsiales bacterium]